MGNPARKGHHHHGAAGAGPTSGSAPATNNYAHHHQHGDEKHNHPLGTSAHAGCPCCSPAPYAGLAGGGSASSSSSSSSGSSHIGPLGPIHAHNRAPPVASVPASSLTMSMQRAAAATTMAGAASAAAATAASTAVRAAVMATAASSTPLGNARAPTHAVTTSMPVPVPGVSAPRAPLRRSGSIMSTSSVTSSVSAATTATSSPSTAGTAPSSTGTGSTPVRGRLARMAAVTLPSPPRPVPTGNASATGATPAEIAASLASSIASSVAASIASSVASSVTSSTGHPATSTASGSTARRRGNVMRMASFRLPSTQVDNILAGNHVESNDDDGDDDDDDPDIEEIRARTQRRAERLVAAHVATPAVPVAAPARVAAPEPPAPVPVPTATTRRLAPTQTHNASWSSDSSSDSDSDNEGAQPTSFDTQYLAALRARQSQLIAAGLATSPAAARAAAAASSSAPRPVPPVQLQVQRAFNTPPPSFPFASAAIPRAPRLGSMYSTSLATPRAIAAASAAITAASFPDRQRRESLGLSQSVPSVAGVPAAAGRRHAPPTPPTPTRSLSSSSSSSSSSSAGSPPPRPRAAPVRVPQPATPSASAAAAAAASELAALADLLGQTPASLRAHLTARHADLHRGERTMHPPADADLVAMLRDLMNLAPAPPRVPAPTVAMASPARVTSGQLL
ncbi:hypothetical protein GGF32_000741 [Allomyces javanicus]|nr:hypothetical protein GGF32_000741 [Allomyces javanicus]